MAQIVGRLPAKPLKFLAVHQFPRGAVGLTGVVVKGAFVAQNLLNELGQLFNGDVRAAANIDVALHWGSILCVQLGCQVHHVNTCGSHVIDV